MRVFYFCGGRSLFDLYPEGDGILQDGAGGSGYEIGSSATNGFRIRGIPQPLFGTHYDAEVVKAFGHDIERVNGSATGFTA